MAEAICLIEGCARPGSTRGWCRMHYSRWWRSGDLGPSQTFTRDGCSVKDCARKHYGHGYCALHYHRVVTSGDPLSTAWRDGERNSSWAGDGVTYSGMHQRLRTVKGSPSAHQCRDCQRPARHWAYDHQDPDERAESGHGPYSTDPAHYVALCVACHRVLDDAPIGRRLSQA